MSQKPTPFDLVWTPIEVAPGAGPLGVYVLNDPDALLDTMDQASFAASDDRMPYYALLWPAGESLAAAVAEGPALAGLTALDLGAGAGPVALAAAQRGARVTALDWAPEAEPLMRAGAEKLGLRLERVVVCDWRKAPADLGRFDRIFGADVLYEARNAEPVARFLAAHLAEGGEVWLADPGRLHAEAFPAQAAAHGLRLLGARLLPQRVHGVTVTLTRFGRGEKQGSEPISR